MRSFTNCPQQAVQLFSKRMSIKNVVLHASFACEWLLIVDIHMYTNCDQIYHMVQELQTFSLTDNRRADRCTHKVIIVQTQGSCNYVAVVSKT